MAEINNQTLLLGAHMSIAGGFEQSLYRGAAIGCNTIQIFTKSNRQWLSKKPISEESATLFQQTQHQLNIKTVVAHASYLINLGSVNPAVIQKSKDALAVELERCHILSIPYLVLHPGSGTIPSSACIDIIATHLSEILSKTTSNTMLLLELMAGHGSSVGSTFTQLQQLLQKSNKPEQLGICFDTCHAWAAGYDFSDPMGYELMMLEFDRIIGLDKLKVIHLNDSKKPRASRVDRHANIGEGTIGLTAFKLIMNDSRLTSIPKILETPKTTLEDDKKNLHTLKELLA